MLSSAARYLPHYTDNLCVLLIKKITFPDKKSTKKPLKKNYKGFQLLRAYPDVMWKVQDLLELREDAQGSGLMWWTAPSLNGSTDLLVPPDLLVDVKDHLKSSKIDFDVVIGDLQVLTYIFLDDLLLLFKTKCVCIFISIVVSESDNVRESTAFEEAKVGAGRNARSPDDLAEISSLCGYTPLLGVPAALVL